MLSRVIVAVTFITNKSIQIYDATWNPLHSNSFLFSEDWALLNHRGSRWIGRPTGFGLTQEEPLEVLNMVKGPGLVETLPNKVDWEVLIQNNVGHNAWNLTNAMQFVYFFCCTPNSERNIWPFSDSSGPIRSIWFSRINYHELLPRKITIAPEKSMVGRSGGNPVETVSFYGTCVNIWEEFMR